MLNSFLTAYLKQIIRITRFIGCARRASTTRYVCHKFYVDSIFRYKLTQYFEKFLRFFHEDDNFFVELMGPTLSYSSPCGLTPSAPPAISQVDLRPPASSQLQPPWFGLRTCPSFPSSRTIY